MRVLVCDDDEVSKDLAKALLGSVNIAVDTVSDAVAAASALRQADYDLVLMDIEMSDFSGLKAVQWIRGIPEKRGQVPIIAVTSHTPEEYRERSLAAGMDGFLQKPLKKDALIKAIKDVSARAKINNRPTNLEAMVPTLLSAVDPALPEKPLDLGIRHVSAVAIFVDDQDRSLAFWTRQIGFELRSDSPMSSGARWIAVAPRGAQTCLAIYPKSLKQNWTELKPSLVFSCDDMQSFLGNLKEQNVVITQDAVTMPWGIYAKFADPDGNEFVVVQ